MQVGDKVIQTNGSQDYIGEILEISTEIYNLTTMEEFKFYRVKWKYNGNKTQYDTAKDDQIDLHFPNEIKLAEGVTA